MKMKWADLDLLKWRGWFYLLKGTGLKVRPLLLKKMGTKVFWALLCDKKYDHASGLEETLLVKK